MNLQIVALVFYIIGSLAFLCGSVTLLIQQLAK